MVVLLALGTNTLPLNASQQSPSTCPGGPRQQKHNSMNVHILNNSHARQKQNEKKALNQVKKKGELKWDEL
jgi:hypothetical protein